MGPVFLANYFVTAVILVQGGLIAVLLREHRRRQFAEVQSRQRMAELAHVNRFATVGELTASISHEINQPLGAILTNTETAQAILSSPRLTSSNCAKSWMISCGMTDGRVRSSEACAVC